MDSNSKASNPDRPRNGSTTWIVSMLVAMTLASCGDTTAPYAEMIIAADQNTVKSMVVSGDSIVVIGTAAIPGIPGTYKRSGQTVTVTMNQHGIRDGLWVKLVFKTGFRDIATSGNYKVKVVDADTFTVTDTASGPIGQGTLVKKTINALSASYAQSGNTITIGLPDHGLVKGDRVELQFNSGSAINLTGYLAVIDNDHFEVTAQAPANTSGSVTVRLGTGYIATDAVMHPSGKWIYVASQYDCYNDKPYCWGGDLISRFGLDWSTGELTFEKSFNSDNDYSPRGAPVKLAFNALGTRLITQDDELDGLRLWSVDTNTGDISFMAQSARRTTSEHGIAISSDGTLVYNGATVFGIGTSPASIAPLFSSSGGNATQIINNALYSSASNTIQVYSLATPTQPVLTASFNTTSSNSTRDLAVFPAGDLIISSGMGGFRSFVYNGSSIVAATPTKGTSQLIDGGESSWPTSGRIRLYRTISLNTERSLAIAPFFTVDNRHEQASMEPSGYVLLSVSPDGGLTKVSEVSDARYTRVARFIQKP